MPVVREPQRRYRHLAICSLSIIRNSSYKQKGRIDTIYVVVTERRASDDVSDLIK